jgi:hypothetical protein
VACGDPTCAPIDTVVQFTWQEGLSKPLGMPMTSAEVTAEDIEQLLSDPSVSPPPLLTQSGDAASSRRPRPTSVQHLQKTVGSAPSFIFWRKYPKEVSFPPSLPTSCTAAARRSSPLVCFR